MLRCPICGSGSAGSFESRYVWVNKCENQRACGHLFADTPNSDAGVQQHSPTTEFGQFAVRNRRLVARLQRQVAFSDGMPILDFGSGSGHLAQAVRDAHPRCHVVCIEADEASQAHLRDVGLEVVSEIGAAPQDVGLLLLVEVVEHLNDPLHVLTALRGRLRPGGALFLTTPCGETRNGGRRTNAYDTQEHVQFFTEKSLSLALLKSGFDFPQFRVIKELYPPRGGATGPLRDGSIDLLRQARAKLIGHHHLAAFSRAADATL